MKNWNFFVKLAIIVFIIFGVVTIVRITVRITELQSDVESASGQIEQLNNEIAGLNEEIEQPVDDDYIIRIARDSLNYHLPSEIVFYNDNAK